ncbi:MAG: T9SS type A sorting domain-containing protein [Saprospiraceae bacterium]|nr:T9SS type A sorting domain-containing protein [Saprospiraceae bacterium]
MPVGFVRNNGKWDPLLILTDADGCIDQSTPNCPTVQIFDLMTGAVDVIGDKKTKIMPNPASDYIIIKNEELVFPVRYHIYTYTGQLINSGHTDMSGSVDVGSICSGIFMLKISDQNGKTESIRWVKE